jgi:cell division protease FtsH
LNRYVRPLLVLAVVFLVLYLIRTTFSGQFPLGQGPQQIGYSLFLEKVKNKEVAKGTFQKDTFEGEYGGPNAGEAAGKKFTVNLPDAQQARAELTGPNGLLVQNGVIFDIAKQPISEYVLGLLLSLLLPLGLLVVFWMFFLRQAQSGGNQALNFGRSRAKRLNDNVPKVTFDDVAGVDEAKQELSEIVEFLKNAKKFQALGAKIPKGVLLLGPPGSGKTLLARAIAGEAGVPFFHISGSDFVEMFVGVGASRVRDLFDTAKTNRPALIFIDEIDAVGRQRGAAGAAATTSASRRSTSCSSRWTASIQRRRDPDRGHEPARRARPALLRPGRFDRRVVVDAPDFIGRKAILGVHTRGKPLSEDINVESLARRTPAFPARTWPTSSTSRRCCRSPGKDAHRDGRLQRRHRPRDRRSRAQKPRDERKGQGAHRLPRAGPCHRAGAAPLADPVHKVTILPRGMALGYTMGFRSRTST